MSADGAHVSGDGAALSTHQAAARDRTGHPRLLVVSNGYGEDLIAARILRELREVEVAAFPLVGAGPAYPPGVPRLGPRADLPSGGFGFRDDLRGLWSDLRAGALGLVRAQRRALRAAGAGDGAGAGAGAGAGPDLVLAVGDVYALWMALAVGAPVALVATADTVLARRPSLLHLALLRRARHVFARDQATAAWLAARGVAASAPGNVMVDCLEETSPDFALPPGVPAVALLPGSRGDAARNAALLARVAAWATAARPEVHFLLALAPTVDADAVLAGFEVGLGPSTIGVLGQGAAAAGAPRPVRIQLTRTFTAAVARAEVVVGLAGTANEQAAALGRPVVAFPGRGAQYTPRFLALQSRVLGEALVPTPSPDAAAAAALRLLSDPAERARRGEVGRQRMGPPGAAPRIAAWLRDHLPAGTCP
ncbi:MAG: lipid-A-disaccharide synthase-related protein [Armatimonadota bacterium]|nr:lipid-A-disaccharide synthase-related protein [Armatimonadota bacterium]